MMMELFQPEVPADECPIPESFRASIKITLFVAWLFYLTFVGRIIFAPLMPSIETDLGISHSQAGTLFLMISLGVFCGQIGSGFFSSRIYHRGTLTVSALVIGVSMALFYFARSILAVRILMFFAGVAGGLHIPSAIATIAAEVRREDWGKALGVHQTAPPLSFVSAPLMAALLIPWFSWRSILVMWGALSLLSAFVYLGSRQGGHFPGQLPRPGIVKSIINRSSFWIMVGLFAMAIGGTFGLYTMLPLFLINERGMDFTWANTLLGLSQISGLFVVFLSGWITDHIGQKRMMTFVLLSAGVLTIFIGTLGGGFLVVLIFLQPAFLTPFFPAAFAALSRIAPPHMRSVATGMAIPSAFVIGGGFIPTFLGYTGETYTFSTGIRVVGALMMSVTILVTFLKLGQYDAEEGC
ncbi:MAG: MFS transporter [Desulfobacteraceae bacterium]|jgi:NNP family nitrate/nitrite transporter-like MFS transporter